MNVYFSFHNLASDPFIRDKKTHEAPVGSRLAVLFPSSDVHFLFLFLVKAHYIKGKKIFLLMATSPF